jgi:hypothetical protein
MTPVPRRHIMLSVGWQAAMGQQQGAFIVTAGRSGSTALSDALSRHKCVLSISEWFSSLGPPALLKASLSGEELWEQLSTPLLGLSWLLARHAEPHEFAYPLDDSSRFNRSTGVPPALAIPLSKLSGDPEQTYGDLHDFVVTLPERTFGVQHAAVFDWLTKQMAREVWVERSGGSYGWLPLFATHYFPEARYVHLYRRGEEVALSMSRHSGFQLAMAGTAVARTVGYNPYYLGQGRVGECPADEVRNLWPDRLQLQDLTEMERSPEVFGEFWSVLASLAADTMSRLPPEQVLHVSYDSLTSAPGLELGRIASFLDVNSSSQWLSEVVRLFSSYELARPTLPKQLVRACKPGNDRMSEFF